MLKTCDMLSKDLYLIFSGLSATDIFLREALLMEVYLNNEMRIPAFT